MVTDIYILVCHAWSYISRDELIHRAAIKGATRNIEVTL